MRDLNSEIVRLGNLDPRLAFGLAQCGSDVHSYSGEVNLTSAQVNQPVPITFQQVPANCYINDFTFDVETALLAPGSLLRGQQQYYNALKPGVDLKLQINQGWGPLNQVLNVDFQPIQHLVRNPAAPSPDCCDWLRGKFVWAWQSFTSSVMLKRALAQGEDPYRVTFGLKVNVLPCHPGQYAIDDAVAGLAGLGIVIPEARIKVIKATGLPRLNRGALHEHHRRHARSAGGLEGATRSAHVDADRQRRPRSVAGAGRRLALRVADRCLGLVPRGARHALGRR